MLVDRFSTVIPQEGSVGEAAEHFDHAVPDTERTTSHWRQRFSVLTNRAASRDEQMTEKALAAMTPPLPHR